MQSIPLTGVVMVSIPQDMVSMIVNKSINMTKMLKVPVLGVVENMSYILCPHCGEKISLHEKILLMISFILTTLNYLENFLQIYQ